MIDLDDFFSFQNAPPSCELQNATNTESRTATNDEIDSSKSLLLVLKHADWRIIFYFIDDNAFDQSTLDLDEFFAFENPSIDGSIELPLHSSRIHSVFSNRSSDFSRRNK